MVIDGTQVLIALISAIFGGGLAAIYRTRGQNQTDAAGVLHTGMFDLIKVLSERLDRYESKEEKLIDEVLLLNKDVAAHEGEKKVLLLENIEKEKETTDLKLELAHKDSRINQLEGFIQRQGLEIPEDRRKNR